MTIRITSKRDGFMRAGVAHAATPTDYADDHFTEALLLVLIAEPALKVEYLNPAGDVEVLSKESLPDEKDAAVDADADSDENLVILIGSNTQPPTLFIGRHEAPLDDLIQNAFEESSLSKKQWNKLPDSAREAFIEYEITTCRQTHEITDLMKRLHESDTERELLAAQLLATGSNGSTSVPAVKTETSDVKAEPEKKPADTKPVKDQAKK